MGGVEAIAPKISEASAPAPRRRSRPAANVRAGAAVSWTHRACPADAALPSVRRATRTRCGRCASRRRQPRTSWSRRSRTWRRRTRPSRAPRPPLRRALCPRMRSTCAPVAPLCTPSRATWTHGTGAAAQDALNAKDAAQQALEDAQGRLEAAEVALHAALAERGETRKCVPPPRGAAPVLHGLTHTLPMICAQAAWSRGAVGAGARERARGVAPQEDVRRGRSVLRRRRVPRRRPGCVSLPAPCPCLRSLRRDACAEAALRQGASLRTGASASTTRGATACPTVRAAGAARRGCAACML
jgi:hypothetical protein